MMEKPVLRILAFDCASRSGWATNAGGLKSGVKGFPILAGQGMGRFWIRARKWITDLIEELKPDLVIYEKPFIYSAIPNADTAVIAFGMTTRVQEIAEEAGVRCLSVQNAVVKQFATGKGNATKEMMLAAAKECYPGRAIADHNEADALLILAWTLAGMPVKEKKAKPTKKRQPRKPRPSSRGQEDLFY